MELCPRVPSRERPLPWCTMPRPPCSPSRPSRDPPSPLPPSSRPRSIDGRCRPAILASLPATRGARYYSAFSTSASAVPAWPAAVTVAMLEADPAPHPNIFLKSSDLPPSSAACVASSIYSPARYLAQNPAES
ncbi:hypothetical protein ZEAMMB73_Zm00001d019724 [Zea mays]|uniref:Uncharacterized protein n=1 Tax=Zea mays TaxID=4577 RepID=A0A1D6I022_MAIZE|nr:hypothetical protein ZEAMMB73_Zm00001d019724 [Zea mays]ONM53643.1 hypothetical protein ZEAMMB73_Zm00001d019724 [Zea mays]